MKKKQKIFMVFSPAFDGAENKLKTYIKNYIGSSITILFCINICKWKTEIDLFSAINLKCICKQLNGFQYQYLV